MTHCQSINDEMLTSKSKTYPHIINERWNTDKIADENPFADKSSDPVMSSRLLAGICTAGCHLRGAFLTKGMKVTVFPLRCFFFRSSSYTSSSSHKTVS